MELPAQITGNAVFTGMAGAALLGFALVQLRSIPQYLWKLFLSQFVTTLEIRNHHSTSFRALTKWLSSHPSAKRVRRATVVEWHNPDEDKDEVSLTPGPGYHMLRHDGRRFLIHRSIEQGSQGESYSPVPKEVITIYTLGRSPQPIADMLRAIRAKESHEGTTSVFFWGYGSNYRLAERRPNRDMDTVYIPDAEKQAILDDARNFLGRRDWYRQRAIPWRRGYLLEGPPGTGKSTLIFAMACALGKSVNIITPSSITNDIDLQQAVNSAGSGIVVIEDIDTFKITDDRRTKATTYTPPSRDGAVDPVSPRVDRQQDGITLSGLLNAIDGIASREGRMLFITSNHPDRLDPALLRPGRIDRRFRLEHIGAAEVTSMYRRFFPGEDPTAFVAEVAPRLPMSPAELQNILLSRSAGQEAAANAA